MINLSILGPPGSGKGFYGKPLAECLGYHMFTVSTVLRNHFQNHPNNGNKNNTATGGTPSSKSSSILDSGALVDCQDVCNILLDFLRRHQEKEPHRPEQQRQQLDPSKVPGVKEGGRGGRGVLLDGFPRTKLQIELMLKQWPKEYHIDHAIHIDVPDSVCQAKMLGRRVCSRCHRPFNVANVDWDGFDLPPIIPTSENKQQNNGDEEDGECMVHFGKTCQPTLLSLPALFSSHRDPTSSTTDDNTGDTTPDSPENNGNAGLGGLPWWTIRKDDSDPNIVQQRLRLHRSHEEPILQYYQSQGHLFTYTPKRGGKDLPHMQRCLQDWIASCSSKGT